MANLLIKALYVVVGAGVACAVPTGILFGIGKSFGSSSSISGSANTLVSQHTSPEETSGKIIHGITCGKDKQQFTMESVDGLTMNEDMKKLLQEEVGSECLLK